MRIVNLYAKNFKILKAIDITPEEDCVIISGKNGAGKSSVIDTIWFALEARAAKKSIPTPLRTGQDSGFIELNLGDYIVKRKFDNNGSTLKITQNGNVVPSPQKLLDGFIGSLSFDPWEFTRMKASEQRRMLSDTLFNITDGEVDLAHFDARRQVIFDQRTEDNRQKKTLVTLLNTMAPPTDVDPTDEVSIDDLVEEIDISNRYEALKAREESLINELTSVRTSMKQLNVQRSSEEIRQLLSELEQSNKRAREVQKYNKTKNSLDSLEKEIGAKNDAIELIDIEKAEALEKSALPITDLTIEEDGLYFINKDGDNVPFCQASSAQQLRVSTALAMAANPTLRVIRIADGSLMDDDSMEIIRNMAEDDDFQIWIEHASRNDGDRLGVYIEEGEIKN